MHLGSVCFRTQGNFANLKNKIIQYSVSRKDLGSFKLLQLSRRPAGVLLFIDESEHECYLHTYMWHVASLIKIQAVVLLYI